MISVQQKTLLPSYRPRLLFIWLISFLTASLSIAQDDVLYTGYQYKYLSKPEIDKRNNQLPPVNGWAKIEKNKYLNFNTVRWKSLVKVFYQLKVTTPESKQYDYYIESNVINCLGIPSGIQLNNQKLDYYKDDKILKSEKSLKYIDVDYSDVPTAILVCNSVKFDYMRETLM